MSCPQTPAEKATPQRKKRLPGCAALAHASRSAISAIDTPRFRTLTIPISRSAFLRARHPSRCRRAIAAEGNGFDGLGQGAFSVGGAWRTNIDQRFGCGKKLSIFLLDAP